MPCPSMPCSPFGIALAVALVAFALPCDPAQAAIVTTYSATDDAWSAPIPVGHFLLDARAAYAATQPAQLTLPALALAYGLAPDVEVGIAGAYLITDLGASAASHSPGALSPYLKVQLPVSLATATFGILLGAQLPTRPGQERTVGVEGAASVALSHATTLDFNLGVGQAFVAPALLTHLNAALYHVLPGGVTLSAEAYAYLPTPGGATCGEQIGVLTPVAEGLTADLSVAWNQPTAGPGTFVPQLGATWAW